MEKETSNKSASPGEKIGDFLFRGIMYLLYGKRAEETTAEKVARVGIIVLILVALIVVFSNIKRVLFQ